ncbi:MAG TPA: M12 family metallopeptidase, partial [Rhabdochlamydiaceae bacterium]
SDRDFLSIENGSSGCWSSVGRTGGKQSVNLQTPGCVSKIGTVIHELLHAVGFLHEQNREDRDKFVKIMTKNIRQGYEINFAKAKAGETSAFGILYDYGSVLHYSANSFSKNGEPTIVAKQSTKDKMGQREGFSTKDIEKLNKMYNCKQVTGASVEVTTTTQKPGESVLENLIQAWFPNSNKDEDFQDFEQDYCFP